MVLNMADSLPEQGQARNALLLIPRRQAPARVEPCSKEKAPRR
jgi:hypothetical protein